MHFVAFHVEPSAATTAKISASCSSFHADTDYRRLLSILFRSIELFHPAARRAVLTDKHTPFDSLPPGVGVHRCGVDPDRVMYSRLLAQIDYLQNHAQGEAVAFLDSDMILNAPLWPQPGAVFDVALTYRSNAEMPLNGGVILVQAGGQGAALSFLESVRAIYAAQFSDSQHWWGDQRALIAAVGPERFASRTGDLLDVEQTRVRLLPCEQYNFSPDNWISAIARELRGKTILHFKGERKRLMPLYWETHLAPLESSDSPAASEVFWRRQTLSFRGYSERALALAQSGVQLPSSIAGKIGKALRKKAG